jgi:hypothetical protein
MFLVGGGIITHGIPALHHMVERAGEWAAGSSGVLGWIVPQLCNAVTGVAAGAVVLALVTLVGKLWPRKAAQPPADPEA